MHLARAQLRDKVRLGTGIDLHQHFSVTGGHVFFLRMKGSSLYSSYCAYVTLYSSPIVHSILYPDSPLLCNPMLYPYSPLLGNKQDRTAAQKPSVFEKPQPMWNQTRGGVRAAGLACNILEHVML